MDHLFVLAVRTKSRNKLYGYGLDLPHCRCKGTRQLQAPPPAICLLQDLKLAISVLGAEDRARVLWYQVWASSPLDSGSEARQLP